MKYRAVLPALTLCLGMLNACGAVRPNKYYQLTVPDDRMSGAARAFPVTLVLGPDARPRSCIEKTRSFTHQMGWRSGQYQYHRWAEPPPEMIHDVLLRKLQLSGHSSRFIPCAVTCAATISSADVCMTSGR